MIIDTIENMPLYKKDPAWMKAYGFLKNISNDIAEGEYEIDGNDIFARVMTYETKKIEDVYPEAHQKYIDIQVVLSGEEMAGWSPLSDLEVRTAYDEGQDVSFYERKPNYSSMSILNTGNFAAFFPEDGHMPSLSIYDKPCKVKKIVIKISVECLPD